MIVASEARSRVCEVPWWIKVMLLVGLSRGVEGAPSRDGGTGGCSTSAIRESVY